MRITSPACPCGGGYECKDGSITCKVCGKPIHSEFDDKEEISGLDQNRLDHGLLPQGSIQRLKSYSNV